MNDTVGPNLRCAPKGSCTGKLGAFPVAVMTPTFWCMCEFTLRSLLVCREQKGVVAHKWGDGTGMSHLSVCSPAFCPARYVPETSWFPVLQQFKLYPVSECAMHPAFLLGQRGGTWAAVPLLLFMCRAEFDSSGWIFSSQSTPVFLCWQEWFLAQWIAQAQKRKTENYI